MSEIITCPSGLSGRIRGMKVREERVLADRRLAKSGGQVDELLAACWEETLDAGPYDFGEKPIDWASRAALLAGNRFETTLPDAGERVWFRLLTGADERKLPQLRRNAGDQLLSAMLAFRVLEVEGVEARDKKKFIEDLSLRDADFLVDEFDRVDCGVDTGIEIECPECFATQEVDLPFDRTFFMPGKERAARRRGRTSSFQG